MPDGFLLKSVVFKLISKEISRAEHEYMNIHPPPPINALATALCRPAFRLYSVPKKATTIQIQIQTSALIQTRLIAAL